MRISLHERTEEHVRIYFERTRDPEIQNLCPQKAQSAEEAVADFRRSLAVDAGSFGHTIYADGRYVGDVWCYCIHEEDEPDAMLSYCIFEKALWGRGIAGKAVQLFLKEIAEQFALRHVGAFTYMNNAASIRVLQKNGFTLRERFAEDGALSGYYQRDMEELK